MKKFLSNLDEYFVALILALMTLGAFTNVIARYVFNASMIYIDELNTVGLVIVSFAGAAIAAKRGAHLGLTVLTDFFPPVIQKVCTLFGHILGIIFSGVMIYYGYLMARSEYVLEQVTIGMQWPEWLFGMWIPICGALLFIRYILLAIKEISNIKGDN